MRQLKKLKKSRFFILFSSILFIGLFFTSVMPFNAVAAFEPDVEPRATNVVLLDLTSGEIIYERESELPIQPGSLSKIMTALVVLDNITDLKLQYVVPTDALKNGGTFREGEHLSVEDLMAALVIASSNDAAITLAMNVFEGGMSEFLDKMNEKAIELGANNTVFMNPTGFDAAADGQTTTLSDMALITKAAIDNPKYMELCDKEDFRIMPTNKSTKGYNLKTKNMIITRGSTYFYEHAIGINTGRTSLAGYTLAVVGVQPQGSRTYLCLISGGTESTEGNKTTLNYYTDAKNLFDWIFTFSDVKVVDSGKTVTTDKIEILSVQTTEDLILSTETGLYAFLPTKIKDTNGLRAFDPATDIDFIITGIDGESLPESVEAPVKKGDVYGRITYSYNGKVLGTVNLVAIKDVEKSPMKSMLDKVSDFFKSTVVKVFIIIVVSVVMLYLMAVLLLNYLKYQKRKKRNY